MNSPATAQRTLLCLLAGVLLLLATSAAAATPHDHEPHEVCRVCSLGGRTPIVVDDTRIVTPRLIAAATPILHLAEDARDGLLDASPLRGPPSTS